MKLIHIYKGCTIFGERSGLFIQIAGRDRLLIDSIHLILKFAGRKKRDFEIDHGDRIVNTFPVWWIRFYYDYDFNKHWLFGNVGFRFGLSPRSDGTFIGC